MKEVNPPLVFDPAVLEAKLAKMPTDTAIRAQSLYGFWLAGKSTPTQNRELLTLGLISDVNGIAAQGKYCKSQRDAAARLSKDLGKNIMQSSIHAKRKAWKDYPWFGSVFKTDGKIDYGELKRRWTGDDSDDGYMVSDETAKRRLNLARAQREERRNEQESRRFDDSWMLTGVAYFIMDAFGVTLKNHWRDVMERQLPQQIEAIVKERIADEATRQKLMEKIRPIFPAKFDQTQIDIGLKMDEISREAEAMNKQQKEETK